MVEVSYSNEKCLDCNARMVIGTDNVLRCPKCGVRIAGECNK